MRIPVCFCVVLLMTGSTRLVFGSCVLDNDAMHCSNCSEFLNHTDIPNNVTSLTYEDCDLRGIYMKLLYRNIQSLRICKSGLENITDGVFDEMINLKSLDLRHNALTIISEHTFDGLNSLQHLYLSYNRLTTLPSGFLTNLSSLISIQLDGNKGFPFSSSFESRALEHVSCAYCNIEDVSLVTKALGSSGNLRDLNLSSNPLISLPPNAFASMSKLESLRLDNCSIRDLNDSSFTDLKQLSMLNASMNYIQVLPSNIFIDSKDSLRVLFLNNNSLTTMNENLLQCSNLKELHIENNPWNCDCSLQWIRNCPVVSSDVTCAEPESVRGVSVMSYTVSCEEKDKGTSVVVYAVVIPIVIVCLAVIACFLYRVIQMWLSRRRHAREKSSVRYSAVYKETVELATNKQRADMA